jgi:tyrosyl-tRNA synthetase
MTMPILVGTDGKEKMSKSLGNYIGVDEDPSETFGKIMSIPDHVMMDYYKLLTRLDSSEMASIEKDMSSGKLNPSLAKRRLAGIIIGYLHGDDEAARSEENFDLVFKKKEVPDDIEEYVIKNQGTEDNRIWIIKLVVDSGMSRSNGEARRLVKQGAIKLDGEKLEDDTVEIEVLSLDGKILQKGKRHFRKIVVN